MRRKPMRVLVCEDNVINQKVTVRLLQQLGYHPDLAGNGQEALARLDAQAYDLIFMDVLMPELDGLEATREIRRRQQDPARHPNFGSRIVIVAMTATAQPGDREKCIAAGMDDYLSKPVRLENVRIVIERRGGSPAANGAAESPTATPVDLARLRELTDGTEAGLGELVDFFLEQTTLQIEQLVGAVRDGQADRVRSIAHSCAGASATCGVRELVPLLRALEQLGLEQKLASADAACAAVMSEFARVRVFLATYSQPAAEGTTGG